MIPDFVLYECDDCGGTTCDDHETTCHCCGPRGTWTKIEVIKKSRITELEAENARLRQQRDAANAQLDFILENTKVKNIDDLM